MTSFNTKIRSIPARFVAAVKSIPSRWNRFWFEPHSPLPLCLFRVIFGAIMVASFLIQFRQDFLLFYGVNSIVPASSVDVYQWNGLPVFDLLLVLPQDDGVRIGFLYFSAFIAFLVMIGFATRLTTVILFLCYLSLCNHAQIVLMAGDNFARLIALFLCFSPCGERVSVDAILRKKWSRSNQSSQSRRPSEQNGMRKFAPTAQRMIQVQLCVIYLVNVSYKLAGQQWRDGSAVYYATRLLDYTRVAIPGFLDLPIVSIVATFSTLVLESSFIFLFWATNKKLRYFMLLVACVFHLGLDYSFSLGVFEWYFIASLILFIEPDDLEKVLPLSMKKSTMKLKGEPVEKEMLARQLPLSEQS